jgi:23S rRNA (uracil1939-C5)-methyltransferase
MVKTAQFETLTLDVIVGGGQALGTLGDGRKAFVWGGLPEETVTIRIAKKKSHFVEGIVTDVQSPSDERTEPADPDSYLSTSPWQIMSFDAEQHYKSALIEEAFELHNIVLPEAIDLFSDGVTSHYRNKVEFSWFGDTTASGDTLDLAFFQRGSKGKIVVDQCSLLPDTIMKLAREIRDLLQIKPHVTARNLKTLLIRSDQQGNCVWQLYVKDELPNIITDHEAEQLSAQGGEVIYSDPRSPASRITKRLTSFGDIVLTDTILDTPFRYATEGFFQVNIPVYEQALRDMKQWVETKPVLDLYAGVGSIGLTIGGDTVTLVEINADAVREMKRNITGLGRGSNATAVLAPSEKALDYLTSRSCIIVDPPRAGLHADVVKKLLETAPERIIYLSCNPTPLHHNMHCRTYYIVNY